MINPELISKFGQNSLPYFAGIASILGEENSYNCYVVPDSVWRFGAVSMPRYIRFNGDDVGRIQRELYTYFYNATNDDDADGVDIFQTAPKEGDIRLCLR